MNQPIDDSILKRKIDNCKSIGIEISDDYPIFKNIEDSEMKKVLHLKNISSIDKNKFHISKTFENLNKNDENFYDLHNESRVNTVRNASFQRNNDSKVFCNSYLSNENFNFNLIESKTTKDLKRFEEKVKNNDSPPIIFGYINIINNLFSKINGIDLLDFYPNLDFLFTEIIFCLNITLKIILILFFIFFNIFLFRCEFFLRFNMYLILINETRTVIDKGEINLIVANIKRWFAFITAVILDELIKFLYLPDFFLKVWTCLMTIYLLLISGPESGVQFMIVWIYKFLRKLNLFY